ncbi:MAG: dockerin type I repeat-containing protein [Phycisphaerales bacterium]|nr:dockerin type I repeat-containing protein [Phycisphaerales bacterium]
MTWTGECQTRDWHWCCRTDTPEGPVFRLNWSRTESSNGCPQFPEPDDDTLLPAGADVVLTNSAEIRSLVTDSASSFELAGGALVNSALSTISGDFVWSGGSLGGLGELVIESPVVFSGTSARNLWDKTLRIADSFIWVADDVARIQLGVNARLLNAGSIIALSNARIAGPSGMFRNEGELLLFGDGASRLESRVEQVGLVEVAVGTLIVQSPLTQWGGSTYVRSGAQLSLSGGATVPNESVFGGPGLVRMSDGAFAFSGDATFDSLELTGAEMNGGTVTINERLNWISGSLRGAGQTLLGPGATTVISTTGTHVIDQRGLVNQGVMQFNSPVSPVALNGSGTLSNAGTIEISNVGTALLGTIPPPNAPLVNQGLIRRVGPPGTTVIAAAISNSGEVRSDFGVLELQRGGTNAGLIGASAGAEVRLNGGNWSFLEGARIGGPGPTTLQTEVTLNGAVEFERATHQNGSIAGNGALTITGQLDWFGGVIRGDSEVTVAGGARIDFGQATASLQRRRLVNHGTLNFPGAGSLSLSDNAMIENYGLMSFASQAYSVVSSGQSIRLQNHGRITAIRTGAPVIGELQIPVISDGEIEAVGDGVALNFRRGLEQNGGMTRLDRASMIASPYTLNDGELLGAGTVRGEVTQFGGVIRPGLPIGALNFTSRYMQNDGTLEIDVAGVAPAQYDSITVISCELLGSLAVHFAPAYQPRVADAFTIITAAQNITGQFTTISAPPAVVLRVDYVIRQQQRRVVVTIERLIGDVNCDGTINNFDIDAFVLALSDPTLFTTIYPDCQIDSADVNRDGAVNNFDIEPFVECVAGGACL